MKAAVLGATFRTAWFDAWEAIAYGWTFFRREWRALLWAYLPYFTLVTITEVIATYLAVVNFREIMLGSASRDWIYSSYPRIFLYFGNRVFYYGLLSALYVYVGELTKSGNLVAGPVSFLSSWKRFYFGFTLLWIVTLTLNGILDVVQTYESQKMARSLAMPVEYTLAMLAGYFLIAPFVAPLLFVFVMEGKRFLRALEGTAQLFVQNYVALVVFIAIMFPCFSAEQTLEEAAFGLVARSLKVPQATGPFNPNSLLIELRTMFVQHIEYGPVLPDNFIQSTPAGGIASQFFVAFLLPKSRASMQLSADDPWQQVSHIAYTVVDWLLILVMFFIYVPAMFYWVKKRLPAEAPAAETPPLEVPEPTSPLPDAPTTTAKDTL